MLIPIVFNSSTSPKLPSALAKISNDEVVLIELQGLLVVEVAQPTDRNGKLVGKLTINDLVSHLAKWFESWSSESDDLLDEISFIFIFISLCVCKIHGSIFQSVLTTMHAIEQGKPTLLIGPHLLEGTINTLNKPLAVLTRVLASAKVTTNPTTTSVTTPEGRGKDTMEIDHENNKEDRPVTSPLTPPTQWKAVGIVKRKIVFAKRPMPIVGRSS